MAGSKPCKPNCTCHKHSANGLSYVAKHKRVVKAKGRAKEYFCVDCGNQACDWATIHGTDGTDPLNHYKSLCRKCHDAYDGHGHKGREVSEETRKKMSESAKARCTPEWSAEHAAMMREAKR